MSASYNQQSCDESNWIIDFERVKPAYTGNNIPIVLSSSDLYAPYAATLIQSIIDNASDNNNYDILYVESGLSGENVRRVKSLCTKSNVSIRIIDISRYKRLPHVKSSGYFSVETYFRLLLPYIFSEYEKVIWLDSDTIVQTDVSKLFCINIGDNLVAATQDYNAVALLNGMDPSYKQFCVEELKMSNPYEYFQAGVLLMNLVEFRKQITVEEIVRLSEESSYPYADQDILNKLCYGRTYRLDNHWDVVADVENCLSNVLAYWEHGPIYESYQAEKLAPKIIHYAGPTKPWHSPANAFSDRFWDVCRKTPFYEVALVRMLSDISKGILRYGMEPFPQTESGYNPNEQSNSILRKGIRCLKENGIRYTLHKIVERICRR